MGVYERFSEQAVVFFLATQNTPSTDLARCSHWITFCLFGCPGRGQSKRCHGIGDAESVTVAMTATVTIEDNVSDRDCDRHNQGQRHRAIPCPWPSSLPGNMNSINSTYINPPFGDKSGGNNRKTKNFVWLKRSLFYSICTCSKTFVKVLWF